MSAGAGRPADVWKGGARGAAEPEACDDVVRQMRTFLFGNWEGNWLAYNYAHDIKLPGSKCAPVAFLMHPQGENADGRLDSSTPTTSGTASRPARSSPEQRRS